MLQVQFMLTELKLLIFKIESHCVAVMVDFLLAIKNPCDSNNKNSFTQMLQPNSFPSNQTQGADGTEDTGIIYHIRAE